MKFKTFYTIIISVLLILSFSSCTFYEDYYKLDPQYLARRQLETKRFEAKNQTQILEAVLQVLQDLGFNVQETESNLGFFSAEKDREADNLQVNQSLSVAFTILDILSAAANDHYDRRHHRHHSKGSSYIETDNDYVYDTVQKIYMTLVVTKSKTNKGFNVRAEFSRIIWNNKGEKRYERILDREIYQEFFDKLASSLFLTAHNI